MMHHLRLNAAASLGVTAAVAWSASRKTFLVKLNWATIKDVSIS